MGEQQQTPSRWMMATSNSWRRIVLEDGTPVCYPTYHPADHHPDLSFPNGGPDGADAKLIIKAPNGIRLAAHRLSLDPLQLAERLEDGGIAELLETVRSAMDINEGNGRREDTYRLNDVFEKWADVIDTPEG